MKLRKIGISGASGTGKSTLAHYIYMQLGLQKLDLTSAFLWRSYGLRSHKELIKMASDRPLVYLKFCNELSNHRLKEVEKRKEQSFVTDRTHLDTWVHLLVQASAHLPQTKMDAMFDVLRGYMTQYNLLVITSPLGYIEDDKKRVTNQYYQEMVHSQYIQYAKALASDETDILVLPGSSRVQQADLIMKYLSHGKDSVSSHIL